MKLGSSMRRRRKRSGGSGKKKSRAAGVGGLSARGRLVLIALAVSVVGSGSGYLYATQVVFPGPGVVIEAFRSVPDLRHKTIEEAHTALTEVELEMGRIDSIRHPEVPSGLILGQTPLAGQLGVAGGAVQITVSTGPERRLVHDVSRLLAQRALTVLEATGFEVEVDSVESDIPTDRVVETDPAAGEEVTLPAVIRMSVSLGPPMIELPDLVGMQQEQALAVLDSLELEVGDIETVFNFGLSPGAVLEQIPAAGEEVARGTAIRLVVARRGFLRDPGGGLY
jgi:eukaryotic-like serine/threonine-protein kinase